MRRLLSEITEEIEDFFEDIVEFLTRQKVTHKHKNKKVKINGVIVKVKPAYVFAKRIESILKIVFGLSIIFSSIVATFHGFTGLSSLLDLLILTVPGRIIMALIGSSYSLLGIWKLANITVKSQSGNEN